MSKSKTKIGFFTIAQYEKEQEWLRKQHNEGWKLKGVTFPCFYHFRACQPEDVVYQLDYNNEGRNSKSDYIQMFDDCGWEYITDFVGYSYFRKPVADMCSNSEEIFNDADSKLEMTKRVFRNRLLPMVVIFFTLILPQLFLRHNVQSNAVFYIYLVLFVIYAKVFVHFGRQYLWLKRRSMK
tara:strand:- start:26 stop:568 length:543 start_codon:yes stop_codon:yes gene_type:complete